MKMKIKTPEQDEDDVDPSCLDIPILGLGLHTDTTVCATVVIADAKL